VFRGGLTFGTNVTQSSGTGTSISSSFHGDAAASFPVTNTAATGQVPIVGNATVTLPVTRTTAHGTIPVVAVEDDSRSWPPLKRHGQTVIEEYAPINATVGSISVSSSAIVEVTGLEVTTAIGSISTSAGVLTSFDGLEIESVIESVRAVADSIAKLSSLSLLSQLSSVVGRAHSSATVSGFAVATEFGSISVGIGPDQVVLEDEEILWLMEVA